MIEIRNGSSRTVVLLGPFALKFPRVTAGYRQFLFGLLGNHHEYVFSKLAYPGVCPVLFMVPGGFLTVMPRCRPMTDAEWDDFDYNWHCGQGFSGRGFHIPAEDHQSSFGWLNGKVVAVDYG